jgi:hypothetical protein
MIPASKNYPLKPKEAPEPINHRWVPVGALLQAIEPNPLNNLLNVPVQIANNLSVQRKGVSFLV